jgi:hypothetical protein
MAGPGILAARETGRIALKRPALSPVSTSAAAIAVPTSPTTFCMNCWLCSLFMVIRSPVDVVRRQSRRVLA